MTLTPGTFFSLGPLLFIYRVSCPVFSSPPGFVAQGDSGRKILTQVSVVGTDVVGTDKSPVEEIRCGLCRHIVIR